MGHASNGQGRHARLHSWILVPMLVVLGMSVASGALLWWGEGLRHPLAESPPPWYSFRFWLLLHGWTNPFVCAAAGYLAFQHARVGWKGGVNRGSGLLTLAALVGLIVTGAGLYYAGGEAMRDSLSGIHRFCGVLLPAAVIWHWVEALRSLRDLR